MLSDVRPVAFASCPSVQRFDPVYVNPGHDVWLSLAVSVPIQPELPPSLRPKQVSESLQAQA